jgi:hypothetical protein
MNVFSVLIASALLGAAGDANSVMDEVLAAPHWEIAPEVSWLRYEEPGVMENRGVLYGVAVAYTRYHQGKFQDGLTRLEGEFAAGEVEYEGSLMDGTPYTMDGNHDYLVNLRVLWGSLWQSHAWESRFYAGFGYRFLFDDSTQDPAGYERYSNYLYVPVGLKTYHGLGGDWLLGLGGEFDVLLVGLQISGIPESATDLSTVKNWQWPGFGARGSLELRHRTQALDFAIAPFIQYWWVDDSSVSSGGWYEPRNNTLQYGVNLIWRF